VGPTPDERAAQVAAAVRRAAASAARAEVAIGGAGAFPTVDRPRAIWLGISRGAAVLGGLADAVDRELAVEGWPPTDRPFRAHLTVARTDGIAAGPAVARRLIDEASGFERAFEVDRITLYESVTGGGPARYVVIEEMPIG
jgi:2'-5' RNA ligase